VCSDHGLLLFEDAAQAAGAEFRGVPAGGFGKSAMFSFTPTKNITMGEGGIVLTEDAATADRLRLLRNHGQRRLYEHEFVGYNWRLTEMQAAMGRVQLRKLDAILAHKRASAAWMDDRLAGLPGVTPPYVPSHVTPTYMLYTCLLDGYRDVVLDFLIGRGIEARVYFPPIHLQTAFPGNHRRLLVTEDVAARMISIPMHAQLSRAELGEVADALEAAVQMASR
jgi:perosamine synthetase